MSEELIHDAFDRLCEHPDFAGGAIFTREDVAHALFEPADGGNGRGPTDEDIARVTDDIVEQAVSVIHDYIWARTRGAKQCGT